MANTSCIHAVIHKLDFRILKYLKAVCDTLVFIYDFCLDTAVRGAEKAIEIVLDKITALDIKALSCREFWFFHTETFFLKFPVRDQFYELKQQRDIVHISV